MAAIPSATRREIRSTIIHNLSNSASPLFMDVNLNEKAFVPIGDINMHLPMQITDYTDSFSSLIHAENVRLTLLSKRHLPVDIHSVSPPTRTPPAICIHRVPNGLQRSAVFHPTLWYQRTTTLRLLSRRRTQQQTNLPAISSARLRNRAGCLHFPTDPVRGHRKRPRRS